MTPADVLRLIAPLGRRIRATIGRGIITLVNDAASVRQLQVTLLAGETLDLVEQFQEYGFASNPLPGAEHVMAFVSGARSHGIVIACEDRRYRLKPLQGGEVALYTDEGDYIKFGRGRLMTMVCGTKLVIDCPRTEFTGDVIDQTGSGNAHTVKNMRDIYDGHHHGGIQAGGALTATPDASM